MLAVGRQSGTRKYLRDERVCTDIADLWAATGSHGGRRIGESITSGPKGEGGALLERSARAAVRHLSKPSNGRVVTTWEASTARLDLFLIRDGDEIIARRLPEEDVCRPWIQATQIQVLTRYVLCRAAVTVPNSVARAK